MMRFVGMASMMIFFAVGFMNGAKVGGASVSFDYASASLDKKTEWLNAQAKPIAQGIKDSLPKGYGPAPGMTLKQTRVDARKNTINFDIYFKGRAQLVDDAKQQLRQAMETLCPEYAKLPIGKNKVYVMQNYFYQNGQHALTVGATPITCRKYM